MPDIAAALSDRYSIERELGAGGMATVYLARDSRHDRLVALKVLRPELAAVIGAERFLSEIRTTANLQHPHILPLFDSGRVEAGELLYYVMPFVDGESLRERLGREKQLPVPDALRIATEIASALDYAHRRGVIHRDIKPENILLHDGTALVADFGIALAATRAGGTRMTETGMSLGTPHYMSPEQAMGEREITARSDVYALGAVTYEMLLGEPPFTGPTAQAVVARAMTEAPPPIVSRRERVPQHVEDAVLTALEKLPADRFASAGEFAAALADPGRPAAESMGRRRAEPTRSTAARSALAITGIAALALGAIGGAWAAGTWRSDAAGTPGAQLARFEIGAPGLWLSPYRGSSISPDGRTIVYTGASGVSGRGGILLRRLDSIEPEPIPITEGVANAALSRRPGEMIFARGLETYRVPVSGGQPVLVEGVPLVPHMVGAENGDVVYEGHDGGVWVAPVGGTPRLVSPPDTAAGERRQNVLDVLPGSRHALVLSNRGTGSSGRPFAVDLETGERRLLLDRDVAGVWYAGRESLVFSTPDHRLHVIRFDPERLETSGEPVPFGGPAGGTELGITRLSTSWNGSVLYAPYSPIDLALVRRDGTWRPLLDEARPYHNPRISPDGRRVALDITDPSGRDVWVLDLASRTLTRVTFDNDGHDAIWSRDGRSLVYVATRSQEATLLRSRLDGSAGELLAGGPVSAPLTWTPDGRVIAAAPGTADNSGWNMMVDSVGVLTPYMATDHADAWGAVSPDGRWIAYASDASRRLEVYVQPLGGGPRVQVSSGGGSEPVWSADGREVFYRSRGGSDPRMMSARLELGDEARVVSRDSLFSVAAMEGSEPHANYSVTRDGEFLMVRRRELTRLVLVQNVDQLLER